MVVEWINVRSSAALHFQEVVKLDVRSRVGVFQPRFATDEHRISRRQKKNGRGDLKLEE